MEKLKVATDYTEFDPAWYIDHYFKTDTAYEYLKVDMKWFSDAFKKFNIRGKKLLDIGTGPSIHTVVTLSKGVDEIYLSDYTPQNITFLNEWKNGASNQSTKHIKYANELDRTSHMTDDELENSVRQKVKGIYFIDVTLENPLKENTSTFDVIVTSCCLEAAVVDVDSYKQCFVNISRLLKKEGYILMIGDLGGEFYQVKDLKYRGVTLSQNNLKECVEGTGFSIVHYEELEVKEESNDCAAYFFLIAIKH